MNEKCVLLRVVLLLSILGLVATFAPVAIMALGCFVPLHTADFEDGVGSEWSLRTTAVTPAGARRFLGLFGNDNVRLGLTNLPPHTQAKITFDLYLKDSWDGNEGALIGGPDRWSLSVEGGPTLLDTTFSLLPDFCDCQAYPDNYPGGNHLGGTGAAEQNTLGYTFQGRPMDAVYHLSFLFPHASDAVAFNFLGDRTSLTISDEAWGIDNMLVEVDTTSAPQIVSAPQGKTATPGSEVLFTVEAKYASTYQWLFQRVPLAGATNATLLLTNIRPTNAGAYSVTVSNCVGSVTPPPAQLTVISPPMISAIPDQATREDTATAPIPFTIGDADTPLDKLVVTGQSSNPMLVPATGFTFGGAGASRTLVVTPAADQFGTSTNTVTVSDGEAAASTTFELTVTPVNEPQIAISRPADRASYCPNSNIEIEAVASGAATIHKIEFYAGTTLLGTDDTPPFTYTWENVNTGDYALTAKATDATGKILMSVPVHVTVSQLCGDVAIVRPQADPEIEKLQDYLFEMGLASRVFDADTVTKDQLLPYRLVIWHGQDRADIGGRLVGIFDELQQSTIEPHINGMPFYFIGEHLAQSSMNLAADARALWSNLTRLHPGNGRAANDLIQVAEVGQPEDLEPILRWRFGNVESFAYTKQVDLVTADVEAQVYATGKPSGTPVFVSYPQPDNPDRSLARTFTQICPVTTDGDTGSVVERKKLFQNAVCWLIDCGRCHALSLSLNMEGPTEPVQAGSEAAFTITVRQAGECEASAVVVTDVLPDGLRCLRGESTQGSFECNGAAATFHIGHMQSASSVEMRLIALALRPGTHTNCAAVRANNAVVDPSNTACANTVVEGELPPALSLEQIANGRLRLIITGTEGRTYRVERTDSLTKPISWSNFAEATIKDGKWESEPFDALGGVYFRGIGR